MEAGIQRTFVFRGGQGGQGSVSNSACDVRVLLRSWGGYVFLHFRWIGWRNYPSLHQQPQHPSTREFPGVPEQHGMLACLVGWPHCLTACCSFNEELCLVQHANCENGETYSYVYIYVHIYIFFRLVLLLISRQWKKILKFPLDFGWSRDGIFSPSLMKHHTPLWELHWYAHHMQSDWLLLYLWTDPIRYPYACKWGSPSCALCAEEEELKSSLLVKLVTVTISSCKTQ